jgi:cobalt transporter subunit CbtB
MTTKTLLFKDQISTDAAHRVGPAVLALLFGAFLVFGTGFAHSTTIHNAAHDGRHALAFPCH